MSKRVQDDVVLWLRSEAGRNAMMQGDKEHQTNQRRKVFRGRNHMLTKAANHIEELDCLVQTQRDEYHTLRNQAEELEARLDAVKVLPQHEFHDRQFPFSSLGKWMRADDVLRILEEKQE